MKTRWLVVLALLQIALLAVVPGAAPATAQTPPSPNPPNLPTLPAAAPICGVPARVEAARCHAWRRTDRGGNPHVLSAATNLGPRELQDAYGLAASSSSNGANQVVAIVDAYDHPNAEGDLNTYRSRFTLGECTTANGCFRKVNQNGIQAQYPAFDEGWAQEIALDIQMVSAICPNCKILLVEANSNSYADLGQAVRTAAAYDWGGLKTKAISNSYGGGEFAFQSSYEAPYNQPGIAVTVSSGDAGYGAQFPASSRYVTAVGGTSLFGSIGGPWDERVWSGAGSGCSRFSQKPSWQRDAGCNKRTVADVAAVADPSTGVLVAYNGSWWIFGGTSVASPIVASVYALAGNFGQSPASYLYSHASYGGTGTLFDVTSGSNGSCGRKTAYLCTGTKGFDGPTGLGTPRGIGAF